MYNILHARKYVTFYSVPIYISGYKYIIHFVRYRYSSINNETRRTRW